MIIPELGSPLQGSDAEQNKVAAVVSMLRAKESHPALEVLSPQRGTPVSIRFTGKTKAGTELSPK